MFNQTPINQPKLHHRKDIDALRALAVLAVIGFHFFPSYFHLGFLGVDLFFVISGYLITKMIQDQLISNRFSYVAFYIKRIKRIFPAMLVMLIATGITATYLLIASDLLRFSKSLLATLSFVANIYFWRTGGYFSTADELKPLLHMWSLGVEEQFYLFFPLALVLVMSAFRRPLGPILVILLISACSYASNIYIGSIGGANPAFFLLPTRVWQFGLGSLFALLPPPSQQQSSVKTNGIFLVGMSLIGLNFIVTPDNLPSATFLSMGAALILWNNTKENSALIKLFTIKPLQLIGLCSFSLYLWHWPILVFLKYVYLGEIPTYILIAALVSTFIVSYLSWRYIENPFREATSTKVTILFICVLYLMLALTALATLLLSGFPNRDSKLTNAISAAVDSNYRCPPSTYRLYGASRACLIGESGVKPTIALLGNSHAQMYAPALNKQLIQNHQAGLIIPLNGCLPTFDLNISLDCLRMAKANYETLANDRSIEKVVIAMTWYSDDLIDDQGIGISDSQLNHRKQSVLLLIDNLTKAGKTVFLVGPIAIPNFDFASLASRNLKFGEVKIPFSTPRDMFDQKFGLLISDLSSNLKNRFITPHELLCGQYQCNFADTEGAYFSDSNHLSSYGVEKVQNLFKPIFEK